VPARAPFRHHTERRQNYERDEGEDIPENVGERELGGCAAWHAFAVLFQFSHKEAQKTSEKQPTSSALCAFCG